MRPCGLDRVDSSSAFKTSNVHHQIEGVHDGVAGRLSRQTNVRCENAMSQSCQSLLARVRVDRAETSAVASIQRLKEVERFSPSNLPENDPIRSMSKGRPHELRNRYSGRRGLLSKWHHGPTRLEADHVG